MSTAIVMLFLVLMQCTVLVTAAQTPAPAVPSTSTTANCRALADCLLRVETKEDECSELWQHEHTAVAAAGNTSAGQANCRKEVKTSVMALRSLEHRKREVFKDCLLSKAPTSPALKRNKAAKCASASRRVDQRRRFRRQSPGKAGRAERRAQRRLEKQRRKLARKQNKRRKHPVKACLKQAKQLKKACRPLIKCCTAVASCNADFKASPLNDQLNRAESSMKQKKRQCKAQAKSKSKGKRQRNGRKRQRNPVFQ